MNITPTLAASSAPARLKRGAAALITVFWIAHFTMMWMRSLINDRALIHDRGESSLLEGTLRRLAFAIFGAMVSYVLYRCLQRLRLREFERQAMIGAALAFAAACVQSALNTAMFNSGELERLTSFIYYILYWFWFYFSWTAAYLALAYSLTVQAQERHAAELVVRAQEAQVRALRYQINPHFLFNTLNAIAALVRDAPQRAEEMVLQLSDFFRRTLAVDPTEDLTLTEEVDLQRLYLEIERTRFPDRLHFEVSLDPETAAARVPALLLQPLVENAVKHGVARSETPTCILIRSQVAGEQLEIIVENDARTEGPCSKGETVGLRNVEERLRSLFGDEASLTSGAIAEGT